MTPAVRTARAEQARETRRRLLDVALDLFAERGYDGTSLQMIADKVGVTKAAVYYHFRTKADILEALNECAVEAMDEVLDAVSQIRSRRERTERLAVGIVDVLLQNRNLMTILASDPVLHSRMKTVKSAQGDLRERVVDLIFGEEATLDQRVAVYAAGGVIEIIPLLDGLPDDELRSILIHTCLHILRMRPRGR
jgi:AcrR family transcriptional regulator